jgi:hypothetical protein
VNLDKINSRGSFDEAFLSKVVPGSTELSNQLVDKLLYRKIHDAELLSKLREKLTTPLQVETADAIAYRKVTDPAIFLLAAEVKNPGQKDVLDELLRKGERDLAELQAVFQTKRQPTSPGNVAQSGLPKLLNSSGIDSATGIASYRDDVESWLTRRTKLTDATARDRIWRAVRNDLARSALDKMTYRGVTSPNTLELVWHIDSEFQHNAVDNITYRVKSLDEANMAALLSVVIANTRTKEAAKLVDDLSYKEKILAIPLDKLAADLAQAK